MSSLGAGLNAARGSVLPAGRSLRGSFGGRTSSSRPRRAAIVRVPMSAKMSLFMGCYPARMGEGVELSASIDTGGT